MAYRTILDWLKWTAIAVWVFAFFVAANMGYYVYVHEPAVKANIIKVAALSADNRALNTDVAGLQRKLEGVERVIVDYSIIYGFTYPVPNGQDP
jgi:hypothetical protein